VKELDFHESQEVEITHRFVAMADYQEPPIYGLDEMLIYFETIYGMERFIDQMIDRIFLNSCGEVLGSIANLMAFDKHAVRKGD
jgi:hypothetical protein